MGAVMDNMFWGYINWGFSPAGRTDSLHGDAHLSRRRYCEQVSSDAWIHLDWFFARRR